MVHKFYAIRDAKAIKRGTIISTLFALIIGGSAYFVGGFGRLFESSFSAETMQTIAGNKDAIMPAVLNEALPPVLLGLILVLLLAASMSTLSSLVLVSSSAISMDLIKGSVRPGMSDKTMMVWMRALCALFVIISLVIALLQPAAIVTLMSYSWGALSGCFLAPFLLGIRWKGMTKAGAWAGIITGLVVVVPGMVLNIDRRHTALLDERARARLHGHDCFAHRNAHRQPDIAQKFDAAHITAVFGGDETLQRLRKAEPRRRKISIKGAAVD